MEVGEWGTVSLSVQDYSFQGSLCCPSGQAEAPGSSPADGGRESHTVPSPGRETQAPSCWRCLDPSSTRPRWAIRLDTALGTFRHSEGLDCVFPSLSPPALGPLAQSRSHLYTWSQGPHFLASAGLDTVPWEGRCHLELAALEPISQNKLQRRGCLHLLQVAA